MDWPRAKTILIIAFIALNGFLAFHLYGAPVVTVSEPAYLAAASEQQVADSLAPFGAVADLPTLWPSRLPNLRVRPVGLSVDPAALLGSETYAKHAVFQDGMPGNLYTAGERRLSILADGRLVYVDGEAYGSEATERAARHPDAPSPDIPDIPEANQRAIRFISEHGGLPEDMVALGLAYDDEQQRLTVRFEQRIPDLSAGNLTPFDGFIEVQVGPEGIARYERRVWTIEPESGDAAPVLPITTLMVRELDPGGRLQELLTALERRDAAEALLVAELGYVVAERTEETEDGLFEFTARPAWRIRVGDTLSLFYSAESGMPLR